jgi:hypothetical protein
MIIQVNGLTKLFICHSKKELLNYENKKYHPYAFSFYGMLF